MSEDAKEKMIKILKDTLGDDVLERCAVKLEKYWSIYSKTCGDDKSIEVCFYVPWFRGAPNRKQLTITRKLNKGEFNTKGLVDRIKHVSNIATKAIEQHEHVCNVRRKQSLNTETVEKKLKTLGLPLHRVHIQGDDTEHVEITRLRVTIEQYAKIMEMVKCK